MEHARIRLHDVDGDDFGIAELPAGWQLEAGDLLVDENDRLAHVTRFIPSPPGAPIAALVEVSPLSGMVAPARDG